MTNGSASGQCSVDVQRSVHQKRYRQALEHGENSIGERLERKKTPIWIPCVCRYVDTLVYRYVDMWIGRSVEVGQTVDLICGYIDMSICASSICRYIGMLICGYVDVSICRYVDRCCRYVDYAVDMSLCRYVDA